MKKATIILSVIIFCSSCIDIDNNKQYVKEDFVRCTDLKDPYTVIKSEFKANQAITIAEISEEDKKRLLNKFKFVSLDTYRAQRNAGYVSFRLFDETDSFIYHMADYNVEGRLIQGHEKEDGYYMICISKTENEIIFCENFPELPLSPF